MRPAVSILLLPLLGALALPVAAGAEKGGEHWAYGPLRPSVIPDVEDLSWPRGLIDHHLLAAMEARGLRPVADADRAALIRRATYDLTGLPPSAAEVAAFAADASPFAFAELVERLLASPAYGERWGRHWLDVVRYADTSGSSSDHPVPEAYRYRDYVIAAFNKDMPYDQFVREQLAGDLLESDDEKTRIEQIVATGYLAGARRFGVSGREVHLTVEDTIINFGEAFLATSLGCARCHDHTHDPVPSTDYYALYGIFASTRYPFPGSENEKQPSGLTELPGGGRAYAVADAEHPADARFQEGGRPGQSGEPVPRGFLQMLGGAQLPAGHPGSGRVELAGWLTGAGGPLFARVAVNRIWGWHFGRGLVSTPNDFGSFGEAPSHPELLEYLARQFIADGYSFKAIHRRIMLSRAYGLSSVGGGSNTEVDPGARYRWRFERRRLSAEELRDSLLLVAGQLDRRMGVPHPFPPPSKWKYTQHGPFYADYDHDRRSVYLMRQRIRGHPMLSVFDGADPNASTPRRETVAGPVQALFLMNSPFAHRVAAGLAVRIATAAADDPGRIAAAHRIAFGRDASRDEIDLGADFLASYRRALAGVVGDAVEIEAKALSAYARALLGSGEFIYID